MNHLGTINIETKNLRLRRFTSHDATAMYHNWASDDKVTKFLRWPTHHSVEVTQAILNEWIGFYENKAYYQWAIVLKAYGNEPIGTISVVDLDEKLNRVQIGYCLGSRWWNQGIMTEAFRAIIPFFFLQVHVNRIEARHDPKNPNSGKVMLKCGLTYEGTMRQADYSNQGVVDAAIYSLLADDFFTRPDVYEAKLKGYMAEKHMKAEHLHLEKTCHSVQEAAEAVGASPEDLVKNICLIDEHGALIVAIVKGEDRVSTSRVSKALNIERPRTATEEEILQKTGYPCGGVPSFGYEARFVIDPKVMEKDQIYSGGGSEYALVKLSSQELIKINHGVIVRARR
jgi:ribosomal-protein-alanine N-acetyltransferase